MDQEMTAIMGSLVELAKSRPNQESTTDSQPLSKPAIDEQRIINKTNEFMERVVPKKFRNANILDCDPKIRELCDYDGSVFITGPAGTGKTHLAASLLRDTVYRQGMMRAAWDEEDRIRTPKMSYAWQTVPEVLLDLRASFKERSEETEKEIIDSLSSVDYLVLDDMGAEKSSDFSIQSLYLVIDRRYSEERKTIVTSNLSIAQIADKLGDRIASRIAGMCRVIELKGRDRRLNKEATNA